MHRSTRRGLLLSDKGGQMNRRRKLMVAMGASAFGMPFAAFAQQQNKVWRVGFLSPRSRPANLDSDIFAAFASGMRELGYVEGKNLAIEWRFAGGKSEALPALAAELVRLKVDLIVASSTQSTLAAQKATVGIPIVMGSVSDPVGNGFIKSLARPGGNITGFANLASDLAPKRLEMLRSMVPKLARVAALVNPSNPGHAEFVRSLQAAGKTVGVVILPVPAGSPPEIDAAFAAMKRDAAGAVIVAADQYFREQRTQLATAAAKHRMPSIFANRAFVEAGGLLCYGADTVDLYRRAATHVDKIFKGTKPGDIPVEQPTKFELFINGKTAKALGLKIPQSLLIMADKVIEW